MRSVIILLAFSGCAHGPRPVSTGPELEVVLDEGRASERPLTPDRTFEMLVRVDPKLPAFRLTALRFLLAKPGHIVFTFYGAGADGRPGDVLKVIDRTYGPEFVSGAADGKWVVEPLDGVAPRSGSIFVGLYSPEKESDPRLWASSNDTGNVFQRDIDPSAPLESTKVRRTPKLRVVVSPAGP